MARRLARTDRAARFARVGPNDNASVWRYRYPTNFIGQTIYVKLQSFNTFGNKLQDLSSLSPRAYTLNGAGSITGWVRVADWITAATDLDFVHDRYWHAGGFATLPGAIGVSRASSGYAASLSGQWTGFADDVARRTDRGLLVEEARTNALRNNSMQGAVAGSPGTVPTRWAMDATAGLTRTIVGTGTVNGIDYIDVRIAGTAAGAGYFHFTPESSLNFVAASNGQVWAWSWWEALVAGSFAGVTTSKSRIEAFTAAGAYLGDNTRDRAISDCGANARRERDHAHRGDHGVYPRPAPLRVEQRRGD